MSEKGQTSVEYIFMILVVTSISISAFKKIEKVLISNNDSFINAYLGAYQQVFGGGETQGMTMRYKRFPLRR